VGTTKQKALYQLLKSNLSQHRAINAAITSTVTPALPHPQTGKFAVETFLKTAVPTNQDNPQNWQVYRPYSDLGLHVAYRTFITYAQN
jgi:hypothetical protein